MSEQISIEPRTVPVSYQKTTGMVPAVFGCIFGIAGIFVLAVVFVPLAVLFGVIGLIRASSSSISLASAIALALAAGGFWTSPFLLILTGVLFSSAIATGMSGSGTVPPPRSVVAESRPALSQADQQELFILFQRQVEKCWTLGVTVNAPVAPKVRVNLSKAGDVIGVPTLLNFAPDQDFKILADTGMAAIRQCSPYTIPAKYQGYYDVWSVLNIQLTYKARR